MTLAGIEEGVGRCIDHCLKTGEAPVAFVLHKFVDITEEDLAAWLRAGESVRKGERGGNGAVMRRYRLARRWDEFKTFYWLALAQKDPKNASFAMFNLKQAENGGYGEKETRTEKATVVVRLEGVGGAEGMK